MEGNEDIEGFAIDNDIDIIYCEGKQKEECWKADIWIDDYPLGIPPINKIKKLMRIK